MRQAILKQHKPGSLRHISGSLKFHRVYSFKWKTLRSLHGHISTVMFDLLLAAILTVASFLQVMAQTKPDSAAGKSAGSFSLSDFDAVNLYNGNLLFSLPLLIVGGRGHAGYSMGLNINSLHWKVESESVGGGGTEHICVHEDCDPKYIVTVTTTTVYETSDYTCVGSDPCIYSGSTFDQIDSSIVLDGSPL